MQDLNGYCLTPGKFLWVVTLSSFINLSVMEDDTFYHHCTLGHEKNVTYYLEWKLLSLENFKSLFKNIYIIIKVIAHFISQFRLCFLLFRFLFLITLKNLKSELWIKSISTELWDINSQFWENNCETLTLNSDLFFFIPNFHHTILYISQFWGFIQFFW